MKWAMAALGMGMVAAPAMAADWCAERPGLATPACTLSSGQAMIETSLMAWQRSRDAGVTSRESDWGSTQLRVGIGPGTEVRASWTPWIVQREEGAVTGRGVGDLVIGIKHRLTAEDAATAVAVIADVKAPVAKASVGNGQWEASLRLPVDVSLADPLSLTLTPEADWLADEDGRGHHGAASLTGSLGVQMSDKVTGAFDLRLGREFEPMGARSTHRAALSVAVALSPKLRWDVQADHGLSRSEPNLVLTTGFALALGR